MMKWHYTIIHWVLGGSRLCVLHKVVEHLQRLAGSVDRDVVAGALERIEILNGL